MSNETEVDNLIEQRHSIPANESTLLADSLINQKEMTDLSSDKSVNLEKDSIEFLDYLKEEIKNEKEYLCDHPPNKIIRNTDLKIRNFRPLISRLFIQHLKYLEGTNVQLIKDDSKLQEKIKLIDANPMKTILTIPILYIENPDDESYQINIKPDPIFYSTMESLGIILTKENFMMGNYTHIKELINTTGVISSSTALSELVFQCPSIHSNAENLGLENSKILILWNARKNNKNDIRLPSYCKRKSTLSVQIIIIVTPIKNNFFKINVLSSNGQNINRSNF